MSLSDCPPSFKLVKLGNPDAERDALNAGIQAMLRCMGANSLPDPTGHAGEYLTTDGSTFAWEAASTNPLSLSREIRKDFHSVSAGDELYAYVSGPLSLTGVSLLAKQSGDLVVDVRRTPIGSFPATGGDSICAAAKPTLATAQTYLDTTLTGWSTSSIEGDTLTIHVDSVTTVTDFEITLYGQAVILPLVITGHLPDATSGDMASYSYTVTGGYGTTTVTIYSGALPAGASISTIGAVSGTYTTGGSYSWVLQVEDSLGSKAYLSDSNVVAWATLAKTGALTDADVGDPVGGSITLSGGDGTYTVDASPVSGARPPGNALSLIGALYSDTSGYLTTQGAFSWTDRFHSGDGQTLDVPFTVSALFSPVVMFASGQRGGWYDPSDLSTLFQDSAGTIPVTTTGQSVGKMLDKSGNGNHVTQSTSGKRPVLQNDGTNNYLQFTATNSQFLATSSVNALYPGYDSITLICGWKADLSVDMGIMCRSLAAAAVGRYAITKNPPDLGAFYTNSVIGAGAGRSGANASSSTQVISWQIDRTTTLVPGMWVDGVTFGTAYGSAAADSGANNTPGFRFLIGAYNNATDSGEVAYATGRFYGGIVWLTSVDNTVRAQAEVWTGGKCGVVI